MNKIHPAARIVNHQERITRLHEEIKVKQDQIAILEAELSRTCPKCGNMTNDIHGLIYWGCCPACR